MQRICVRTEGIISVGSMFDGGDAMATALDWEPDPFQPDSVHARGGATTYRVTSGPPATAGNGAITAHAGDCILGRFPCTAEGRRAALTACESHAAFVGDSLRAQAEIDDEVSAQSS